MKYLRKRSFVESYFHTLTSGEELPVQVSHRQKTNGRRISGDSPYVYTYFTHKTEIY